MVLLTKADLCDDVSRMQAEAASFTMGAAVLTASAADPDGYRQIMPYIIPGRTVAFVGSSGVRKSTLINRLLGEDRLATDGLRNDDKGHHTTTHRELLVFCQVIIPGFAKANSLVLPRKFPGNCQINSLVLPRYFTRMRALRRR